LLGREQRYSKILRKDLHNYERKGLPCSLPPQKAGGKGVNGGGRDSGKKETNSRFLLRLKAKDPNVFSTGEGEGISVPRKGDRLRDREGGLGISVRLEKKGSDYVIRHENQQKRK